MTTPASPNIPANAPVPGASASASVRRQGDVVDTTMMYAFHDGLRRDAVLIASSAAATRDDPARLTATHFGWTLFKQFLVIHHTAEDDVLWPALTELVDDRPDDLELLAALEDEHTRIDPLVAAIDAALADAGECHARLGDLADALVTELTAHLAHEEKEALPLIGAVLPQADWVKFADAQRDQVAQSRLAPSYVAWLLDGCPPERVTELAGNFPPPVLAQYRSAWKGEYESRNPWARG